MTTISTTKGNVAIVPVEFKKIESEVTGGIARISQRINLIDCELVMGYNLNGIELLPGDKIILRGEAGLQPWAKSIFNFEGKNFVLCPESQIIGFKKNE